MGLKASAEGAPLQGFRLITAAGPVTMLSSDGTVEIAKTVAADTTVNLPVSPTIGLIQTVKDGGFNCTAHPITLVPFSGNIDGASTYVMNLVNGQSISLYWNGTNFRIV